MHLKDLITVASLCAFLALALPHAATATSADQPASPEPQANTSQLASAGQPSPKDPTTSPASSTGTGGSGGPGPTASATGGHAAPGSGLSEDAIPGWGFLALGGLGATLALGAWHHRTKEAAESHASSARSDQGLEPSEAEQAPEGPVDGPAGDPATEADGADRARDPVANPGPAGAMMLGREAIDEASYEAAAGWFELAGRLETDQSTPLVCHGAVLRELGEPEQAVSVLEEAVDRDPTDALARLEHARALADAGRDEEVFAALSPLTGHDEEIDETIHEDPAFAHLHDHPRFLALVGHL